MLNAMSDGSFANCPISRSAGGQEEQPWLVNSSRTACASAALAATTLDVTKHATRIAGVTRRPAIYKPPPHGPRDDLMTGFVALARLNRHSLRGEPQTPDVPEAKTGAKISQTASNGARTSSGVLPRLP